MDLEVARPMIMSVQQPLQRSQSCSQWTGSSQGLRSSLFVPYYEDIGTHYICANMEALIPSNGAIIFSSDATWSEEHTMWINFIVARKEGPKYIFGILKSYNSYGNDTAGAGVFRAEMQDMLESVMAAKNYDVSEEINTIYFETDNQLTALGINASLLLI